MKRITLILAGLMAVVGVAVAAPESGLKPGENMSAFDVVDVTGPDKGKQLCLV